MFSVTFRWKYLYYNNKLFKYKKNPIILKPKKILFQYEISEELAILIEYLEIE